MRNSKVEKFLERERDKERDILTQSISPHVRKVFNVW